MSDDRGHQDHHRHRHQADERLCRCWHLERLDLIADRFLRPTATDTELTENPRNSERDPGEHHREAEEHRCDAVVVQRRGEDGVPVTLQEYQNTGGPYFNECSIDAATATFGVDQTLRHNNINTAYEIHALGQPVAAVTFLFTSLGGEENLRVNGAPIFIGNIESAPINPDGSLGAWRVLETKLSSTRAMQEPILYKDRIYLIGGAASNIVEYATFNADGEIGSWLTSEEIAALEVEKANALAPAVLPLGGTVLKTMNAEPYIYMQVQSDEKQVEWVASPAGDFSVRDRIRYGYGAVMNQFFSKQLGVNSAMLHVLGRQHPAELVKLIDQHLGHVQYIHELLNALAKSNAGKADKHRIYLLAAKAPEWRKRQVAVRHLLLEKHADAEQLTRGQALTQRERDGLEALEDRPEALARVYVRAVGEPHRPLRVVGVLQQHDYEGSARPSSTSSTGMPSRIG